MIKEYYRFLVGSSFLMVSALCGCNSDAELVKLTSNSVKITYIANSGFLIESSENKILIDALFTQSLKLYSTPSSEICNQIINGDTPFDNIKVLFITHAHEDHFSPVLVKMFLDNNENRYVICSDITRRVLENKFGAEDFKLYKDRIRAVTPKIYSSINSSVDELNYTIIRLRHSGESEDDKNLGYLISMNGINILHTGDNDGYIADGQSINGIEEYLKLNIDKKSIDIAIVNRGMFWEKTSPGIEIVKNCIKPKVVILAHLSKNDAQGEFIQVMDVLRENNNEISNVIFFKNSMESKIFKF